MQISLKQYVYHIADRFGEDQQIVKDYNNLIDKIDNLMLANRVAGEELKNMQNTQAENKKIKSDLINYKLALKTVVKDIDV
jgi:hypothetical protein